MARPVTIAILLLLAAASLQAAPTGARPPDPAPVEVHRLSPRVLVLVAEPSQRNTTIAIAGRRGLAVIDTNLSQSYGRGLRRAIREAFGRDDVRYVVNTHCDWDHAQGNQAFADAEIVAHLRCDAELRRGRDEQAEHNREGAEQARTHVSNQTERLARLDPTSPQAERARAFIERMRRYERDLADGFTFVPATIALAERVQLDLGDLTLLVTPAGGAHRDGDLFVWAPEEGLLAIGDLCFDMNIVRHPSFGGGYEGDLAVGRWLAAMDEVLASGRLRWVVQGHSHIRSAEWLAARRDYLAAIWTVIRDVRNSGGSVEDAVRRLPPNAFGYDEGWKLDLDPPLGRTDLDERHRALVRLLWQRGTER